MAFNYKSQQIIIRSIEPVYSATKVPTELVISFNMSHKRLSAIFRTHGFAIHANRFAPAYL